MKPANRRLRPCSVPTCWPGWNGWSWSVARSFAVGSKGERRSRRKGQSVEFADFRNYVPGDDLRFIDWNLYARLDKLFLKLFLEEEDLHFFALIDASESMDFGDPTKLHYAKQLAAALGFIGLIRADRVKIEALSSSRGQSGPALRGRRSVWQMCEYLSGLSPATMSRWPKGSRTSVSATAARGSWCC